MTMRWSAPQVASIVLGAAVAFWRFQGLDGTEFSGGWLSGPMLKVQFAGILLLALAIFVASAYPRAAAVITLVAVLCCLPPHLFFLLPGAFPGERSVPVNSYFEFNNLDFWSAVALAAVALVGVSALRRMNRISARPH
jgi:hypothetical protein